MLYMIYILEYVWCKHVYRALARLISEKFKDTGFYGNMVERYIHIYRVYMHVVQLQKICISTVSYKYRVYNTYRICTCLHHMNMVLSIL